MPNHDKGDNAFRRIKEVESGNYLRFSKKSIKRFKNLINFDSDQPACYNCKHFRQDQLIMSNSTYKKKPGTCKLFRFYCKSTSICDFWESIDGDKLESAQEIQTAAASVSNVE